MPDSFPSLPDARCSALEEFFRSNLDGVPKTRCQSRMTPSIRINPGVKDMNHGEAQPSSPTLDNNNGRHRHRARRTNPRQTIVDEPQQTSGRKPGTSQYYGVRFRPDLNKWVAEIRVAEWKAVDKKVWLGTFETEQAAAHGVDLARKLLKCTKKHPPNLPCKELEAYSKQIPQHLILTDLTATSMFKSATLFIKHECKEYAASFTGNITPAPQEGGHGQFGAPQFFSQTVSTESSSEEDDVLDFDDSDESDFSDMILDMLEADSGVPTLAMADYVNVCETFQSSPSSCNSSPNSAASCVLQGQPEMVWEMSDGCGGCKDATSVMMFESINSVLPEMMVEGMSMMETTLADVGAVSQLQWVDSEAASDDLFHYSWPGLQDDSLGSFTQLPDTLCGLTSYNMSSMHGGYVAPMDYDPWWLQAAHYPFLQHANPSGWR